MKTKHSNRKVDLANSVKKTASEPLDSAAIILDSEKVENLTKALKPIPKLKKIKKEKVWVEKSVNVTDTIDVPKEERAKSLEELDDTSTKLGNKIDPDQFLTLDEDETEKQVKHKNNQISF